MSRTRPADPRCKNCYYVDKVDRQKACIINSQAANGSYKRTIKNLEVECSNLKFMLNIYETMLPDFVKRFIKNKYYAKKRKEVFSR